MTAIAGAGPFVDGEDLIVAADADGRYWVTDGRCAVTEELLWQWAKDRFPRGLFPGRFTKVASPRRQGWHYRWADAAEGQTMGLVEYLAGVDTDGVVVPDVDEVTGYAQMLAVPGPAGGCALPFLSADTGIRYVEFEQVRGLWPDDWNEVIRSVPSTDDERKYLVLGGVGRPGPVVVQESRDSRGWQDVAVFASLTGMPVL